MAGPAAGTRNEPGGAPLALPARPRILVVSLRRIGDLLLTTPLIRSLRRAWPDARIDVLAFKGTDGILAGNPDINKIIAMPARPGFGESAKLMARLWKRYDLASPPRAATGRLSLRLIAGRTPAGLIDVDGPAVSGAAQTLRAKAQHADGGESAPRRTDAAARRSRSASRACRKWCVRPRTPASFEPGENFAVIHAAPMYRYKEWTRDGWRALAAGLKERGLDGGRHRRAGCRTNGAISKTYGRA